MTIRNRQHKQVVRPGKVTPNQSAHDDPDRRTISVEQAGRHLGISRGAAYARAKDGTLPTVRLGKRLLVPKAALDKLLMIA